MYEPHIAPKVERWAEDFLERRRRARSRTLARPYEAAYFDAESLDDKKSDGVAPDSFDDKRSFELENMVTKEVHEWRKEVERSTLRRRKPQLHTSVDDVSIAGSASCCGVTNLSPADPIRAHDTDTYPCSANACHLRPLFAYFQD